VPFGSKNSGGTTLDILGFGVDLGGEGFVEYSVREKAFMLGVLGLDSWSLPLILTPFSIFAICCARSNCTLKVNLSFCCCSGLSFDTKLFEEPRHFSGATFLFMRAKPESDATNSHSELIVPHGFT
jgi:hypothetical protein